MDVGGQRPRPVRLQPAHVQTAELTKPQRDLLARLEITRPKQIIELQPAAH
jgi:hypothetical protein